jgi:glycosyltransferase involved in cell wall biosynthesis
MQPNRENPNPKIQLWSQNYDPEPQGIAPIAGTVARGLADLGDGVTVVASVDADSETARIIRESGAGWVTDPGRPEQFAERAAQALADPAALERVSRAGTEYATENFNSSKVSQSLEEVVLRVTAGD